MGKAHRLIDIAAAPVAPLLPVLLEDKSTGRNIIWATDTYADLGPGFADKDEITVTRLELHPETVRPRIAKSAEAQQARTRKKAEVFTPAWLCNEMNNQCDEDWFGRRNVFNTQRRDHTWAARRAPIAFPGDADAHDDAAADALDDVAADAANSDATPAVGAASGSSTSAAHTADSEHSSHSAMHAKAGPHTLAPWQAYVDSRRLEITCGEAPYLVSRYDVATGEIIPVARRIGQLDRKLRVVGERTRTRAEWETWARRAIEATYGYEYQGDNLLIARINVLLTFCDYHAVRWGESPSEELLRSVANTIAWNLWQMDGLKDTVPLGKPYEPYHQLTFDDLFPELASEFGDTPSSATGGEPPAVPCKLHDWRAKNTTTFAHIKGEGKMGKKLFDYVIGNPPYQEENSSNGRQPPVYHLFMDAADEVGDVVELITPARFLFDAGQTPKAWNEKMLNDEHFKVLEYEPDSSKVFSDTDIKGGVAVSLRNVNKDYGAIGTFVEHDELRSILTKIRAKREDNIAHLVTGAVPYHFSEQVKIQHPEWSEEIGSSFDLRTNILDKMDGKLFFDTKPNDGKEYVEIFGLHNKKRSSLWIERSNIEVPINFCFYKVLVPKASGSGAYGEKLADLEIADANVGHTQSFVSIGCFETKEESLNLEKYIKTKFTRALLGILKVTQDITSRVWQLVPLQDFTSHSDIDWSQSVHDIDQQLYRKYGLDGKEIEFIETHVKEMA